MNNITYNTKEEIDHNNFDLKESKQKIMYEDKSNKQYLLVIKLQ